jgi:hypothetical protein
MRIEFLFPVSAVLVLGGPVDVPAQDDPQAIIAKAIQAVGGMEKVSQPMAILIRVKGTNSALKTASFTGELWTQGPDHIKQTLHIALNNLQIHFTQVVRGESGGVEVNGQRHEMDGAARAVLRQSASLDGVSLLVSLLKKKTFTLKSLGPSKFDGRQVAGITVSAAGNPDLNLYFETETGFLVKQECPMKTGAPAKGTATATVYADYREPDLATADERALKAAGVAVDGPGLVTFLRGQVRSDADKENVQKLIKQLADEAYQVREKAAETLIRLGPVARSDLRQASRDDDPEVARRAKQCLARIDEVQGPEQVSAAVRLLALRKPAGAAEALLALVPSMTDEAMKNELLAALTAVAVRDGKPAPAVVQALQDNKPIVKAAAAAVLGRDGGAYAQQPGRRLFLTGLKLPMKIIQYQGGNQQIEWEVTKVELFNQFDDSVFAPPR